MKLLWSPKSPFVRKVMIVVHELGLVEEVELVRAVAVPRGDPNPAIMAENPLGKIPTLLVPGLPPIFDSAVICDWLSLATPSGEHILPRTGIERLTQLRWQALGDGLIENMLLWRIACQAAAGGDPQVVMSHRAKIRAAMALLETEAGHLAETSVGLGQIAIICALGQLDFRFADSEWRQTHPKLAAYEGAMSERPSVAATAVLNDLAADDGPHMDLTFRKD
ncbi:glutathione S-transferase family protein [Rhizobium sp. RU36D]|uniref:glutathione S-transferase family protein n=1 Tax=Rhizobium sp. RU36D TaxID=1907415 RepID=UPI0009D7D4D6|nr:glutathione S-transferase family protein [Rhizobium sp. RU36D]SMD12767.1 Glutathione S-transferase [Rhizobium sp. RU36D]